MFTTSNTDTCPPSIFQSADLSHAQVFQLNPPQLGESDAEFLLGLNDILDELHPTSDHGPLSGIDLHLAR